MPTLHLTDAAIKKLKPPAAGRTEYWDKHTPGLGLRVSESGVQSWVVIVRALQAGEWRQRRVTLGSYPALSLGEARAKAETVKAAAKAGEDPAHLVKEARQALVDHSRNTFAAVALEFLEKYRGRQKRRPAPATLDAMRRAFDGPDFAEWRDRPLVRIDKRAIMDALDRIVARGAETQANRVLAYLKLLFGWATERGILTDNPAAGIKKPGSETSRDRVLTADEIRLLWHVTDDDRSLFNAAVRVLLLTGQRLNEVCGMRWSELDLSRRLWTLPAAAGNERRTKNSRAHVVPLSAPVVDILEHRLAVQQTLATKERPQPKLVFTTNGTSPFSGFSRAKERLDRRMAALLTDPPPPWRLHDLRRTLATGMAEDLRIPPHIVEAILNHVSGSKGGVAGIYNRALHLDERKAALDAWARHVANLTGEARPDNVVELRRTGT